MKKNRKRGLGFLIALFIMTMCFGTIAQAQTGLVDAGGTYFFFDAKGAKVRNQWETVLVDGQKFKFYFGKNGAAYKARRLYEDAYNVKLFKIGKKQYGFDNLSHLAAPGNYVNDRYQFVAIGKNGVYNASKTKKLRNTIKPGKKGKNIYNLVVKTLGKPVSVDRSPSCSPWNEKDSFTDVLLVYPHYEVQLIQNDRTKEYLLDNYFPR